MIEPGDIATWAAAGVAVVAAGVAGWQTREARKSRIAAQAQATEAAKSREAAETQARAAQEQVALMRADRDERDAPEFSVSAIDAFTDDPNSFAAKVVLCMDRGRALRSLTVIATGEYLDKKALVQAIVAACTPLTFDDIRNGREIAFYVQAKDGYVGSTIDLELTCHERDGERTWQRHHACTITPRPPRTWPTFRPL